MKNNKELRTNYLPAIIMLLAGFIYCLIGIKDDVGALDFTVQLLIVLLIFYILGGIIKLLLDSLMKATATKEEEPVTEEEASEEEETEGEGEQENIKTEDS